MHLISGGVVRLERDSERLERRSVGGWVPDSVAGAGMSSCSACQTLSASLVPFSSSGSRRWLFGRDARALVPSP